MITFGNISIPNIKVLSGRQLINVEIFYNAVKYDWMVYTPFCNGALLMNYLNTNAFIYENDIITKEAIWAITPRTREIPNEHGGGTITVPVLKNEIVKPTIPDNEEQNFDLNLDIQAVKRLLISLSNVILSGSTITQQQINDLTTIYTRYKINNAYVTGDIFTHENKLYEVIQSHTSQIDWLPSTSSSLYKIKTPIGTIAAWTQPLGATDAYPINVSVTHGGKTWINNINNNVWEPSVYGWSEVGSSTTTTTIGGYPAWVQPTGASDDYDIGARVSFDGFNWESLINANVWSPYTYPAGWLKL